MPANPLFDTLFAYKRWANDELYTLLRSLPAATHAEPLHNATRILNHIHVVDQIFRANLQRERHGFSALNTPETPTLAALQAAVRATDDWYCDYVAARQETELAETVEFTFVDGKPGRMTRAEMLAHVITHSNYHRGAVGRILVQLDVAPPRDSLTVFMHRTQPS